MNTAAEYVSFFFSSRRRHTRYWRDWSSDVCSSDLVFFAPELGGYFLEYNNFIPADPLKTPAHIAPVWYFTPFYSMLRATTDQMVDVLCVIVALGAVGGVVKGRFSAVGKMVLVAGAVIAIF